MPTFRSRLLRSGTAVTLAVASCSGSVAALQLLSVADEIQLGRDAQREVQRQVPEVRDPMVRGYVSELGARLVPYAGGADYPYSFSTADARELNAFALPGGPVWINRGILELADDEAQVAGVLAHEIAHVAQRHSARQVTRDLWAVGILAVLGAVLDQDDWRGAAVGVGAMVATGSAMLKYSRNDERAADREGVRILQAAGYDPRGLLEFMQRLDADQQSAPGAVARFFSTHPAPRDRVRHLERLVGDAGGQRHGPAFAEMQRRLSRLPAPRPAVQP